MTAATLASAGNIFDDGSDFMRGFETGVMMRQKKTSLDEFGCAVPNEMRSKFTNMLDNVSVAMDGVKMFIPDDLDINLGFEMVHTYIDGMSGLASVIDPDSGKYLDDYCRGMIFGVEGTQVLFKVASVLRHQDPSEIIQVFDKATGKMKKTKKNSKNIEEKLKDGIGQVWNTVKKNVQNKRSTPNDEL